MVNYQLGKIYKITSLHTDIIYIGSTCQTLLCKRFGTHITNYKLHLEGKYRKATCFELLKLGDCKIELIEAYPCNTKDELASREGYWIKQLDCVNKRIEGRTRKEYYEDNKERYSQNQKKYHEENKEQIATRRKVYYEANQEQIKAYQKEYREANKEKHKEYMRAYRQAHKNKQ